MKSSAFLAALSASLAGPTPQREQHDRIARQAETVADSEGAIGHPWRVESLLERLERRGEIGARERLAGEEFARLFYLAHLDPLKAPDMRREGPRAQRDTPHGSDRARRRVLGALDALGGHSSLCGSCAWHVLGRQITIHAWAIREGSGHGRVNPAGAKGVLIASLDFLARHFGL